MTAGVYLLRDPVSGIVRYVGQSKNIEKRIKQHRTAGLRKSSAAEWLWELRHQGLRPAVVVIPIPDAAARDSYESILIERHSETVFNVSARNFWGRYRPPSAPLVVCCDMVLVFPDIPLPVTPAEMPSISEQEVAILRTTLMAYVAQLRDQSP